MLLASPHPSSRISACSASGGRFCVRWTAGVLLKASNFRCGLVIVFESIVVAGNQELQAELNRKRIVENLHKWWNVHMNRTARQQAEITSNKQLAECLLQFTSRR